MLPHGPEGTQNPLRMPSRFEAAHGPFALARRLVGVFGAVVAALVLPMLDAWQHLPFGGTRARQFVGDQHARHVLAAREELAKERLSRSLVPPTLHEISSTCPS